MARTARVRVVVLNYDGGEMTLRCLDALRAVDWPEDALEVVLVDNASIDGIASRVRRMPWVELVEHTHNVGFAGGCNLGLTDLDRVDYVALLNNDAVPDRNWLRPLVDALEHDDELGAACSKIVFAPSFLTLTVDSPTFSPADDGRELGVKVTGLAADGVEVWDDTQFADGCYTHQARGSGTELQIWTAGRAEIRIPVEFGAALPEAVEIELSAERKKLVRLCAGAEVVEVAVHEEPTWYQVPVAGATYDVINNVGSRLVLGGYGGDRGFLEPDQGQYSQPEEVFAWCGGAVLLSARYLRDVGIFDDRYFMYYEDTDLSWRGRLAGWRYCYVPSSVVRHEHAASSKEGSSLFMHFVERNRFLTLARNAPWSMFAEASYVYLRDTAVILDRDVVRRVRHRARPAPGFALRRLRAYAGFVKLLPETLRARRAQGASAADRARIVERWGVPQ
ncbi:MAG TPA: glycosyltransferase [Acidimicrobiia bacterium]|nr:glycosyltransferase [Acidimicrobiia bacterium]